MTASIETAPPLPNIARHGAAVRRISSILSGSSLFPIPRILASQSLLPSDLLQSAGRTAPHFLTGRADNENSLGGRSNRDYSSKVVFCAKREYFL